MCGLVGFVGAAGDREKELFSQLLLVNTLRGHHGTGLFTAWTENAKSWYDSIKTVEPSGSWVFSQEYEDALLSVKGVKAMMAHSRHATLGEINKDNSHPFITKKKKITGFHNGTIKGKFAGTEDYETDSEALYNLIEKDGLKEALDHVYKESHSVAYALQYYNWDENAITLIRNSQRPLWIAEMYANEYFWASERNFLEMCFIRNNIKPKDIKLLPVNAKVTIKPFNAHSRFSMEENWYKEPPKKTYKNNYYQGYASWWGDDGNKYDTVEKEITKKTQSLDKKTNYKFVKLSNKVMPLEKYLDLIGDGCAVCSQSDCVVGAKLDQKFMPGSHTDFICSECQTDQVYRDFDIDKKKLVDPVYTKVEKAA